MQQFIVLLLKGMGIGAANVIPGVSGGTVALITNIYEKLIDSIKAFDLEAFQILLKFKIKEFLAHINVSFLVPVFLGIVISILTLAKLLSHWLETQEVWVMSFFLGLILVSIYFVGKRVENWNATSVGALVIGTVIAAGIALLTPAQENTSFFYVFICGIVAICSMILPGLSGSFILVIMGNYKLVMESVSSLNIEILIPLAVGCAFGLVVFARIISWIFKSYRDGTIAMMTGFILGSLITIWPWKEIIPLTLDGEIVTKSDGEIVVGGYEWLIPDFAQTETMVAVGLVVLGGITIWAIEKLGERFSEEPA